MASEFDKHLRDYDLWKKQVTNVIYEYQDWLDDNKFSTTDIEMALIKNLRLLKKNHITVAFAAEFSRGKTELINALFFSTTGIRLLPSSPGRTTMCPTELLYDPKEPPYLRLLDIDTRLSDRHIEDYKKDPKQWTQIDLDCDSPEQMRETFQALLETKKVPYHTAEQLGLASDSQQQEVEVPCWRHAVISFPHPLLKNGLAILDTPGLNALGSEPELTLNMLPNAQAMIFVLAADTGVTQSDMEMWQHHIQGYRNKHPHSLAVVLNKIDSLQDDLMSDDEVSESIHKQTRETARLLELDEHSIFPLSAKQALVGKIKGNEDSIQRSQIASLETFLSERIMGSQKEILQRTVIDDIAEKTSQSSQLLSSKLNGLHKHLSELESIFNKSQQTTTELILSTRKEQTIYNKNIGHLKTSKHIFNTQISELQQIINTSRAQQIIEDGATRMKKSWTSVGIRMGMQTTFDELNTMLNETLNSTYSSIKLINAIYKKFKDEHQLTSEQPTAFNISSYQQQLERLLQEGIEFSNSPSAALTEQSILAKRFVNTIGQRATSIFEQANIDVKKWKSSALSPLIAEVSQQKKAIERRLESLKSVAAGKEALETKVTENKAESTHITDQLEKLKHLIEALQEPSASDNCEQSDEIETDSTPQSATSTG
jgi:hypothetical protein